MHDHDILLGLAGIAVLGIGAQWLAWRIHLPSILLLLIAGLVVGPVGLGLLTPEEFAGDLLFPIVSLSVGLILFEGGLTLELSELRRIRPVLVWMCTLGIAITWVLGAMAAHWLAGVPWSVAILLGAILTVTGPTVIGPLLSHIRPQGAVESVAKWEGIVADVIGATLAVLVFHALLEGNPLDHIDTALFDLVKTIVVGALMGALGALGLLLALRRHWIPDFLQSPMTLAVVLGIFAMAQGMQAESGLLAASLMGFMIANQKSVPIHHIVEFKENLRVLLISSLFIVLAALLEPSDVDALDWGSIAFLAALILVVRPISVFVSTWRSDLTMPERIFLAWLAPRGIVAAAVSALFALRLYTEGVEEAKGLASLVFLVIIGTVAVYGITAAPLARRLGLAEPDPQGVLILGASRFARAVGQALDKEGFAVTIVDSNPQAISAARFDGLRAVGGNALTEDVQERLPLGGIGRLLAMTPNDQVNSLAALRYGELFERSDIYQLSIDEPRDAGTPAHLRGRYLFGPEASFRELDQRIRAGATIKHTTLSDEFDYDDFKELHGERALPLFRVANKKLDIFSVKAPPVPAAGDTLLSLMEPAEEPRTSVG